MTVVAPPPEIAPILDALDAEQRAAATLPEGPAQIIAPAGSGKTTTMVARIAVLLSRGVPADRICVVTFNRDAATDLATRLRRRLGATMPGAAAVEVRTLHALARQVLLDVGEGRNVVADRLPLIRAARRRVVAESPELDPPDPAALDTALSRWKIDGEPPDEADRSVLETYGDLLRLRGAIDFDDLVVRAGDVLADDPRLRTRWQSRFAHVCVDEFQDVDAAQLRLVRLLAAPEDNLFVVGDDDQTIYAWRLADVRRILRFGDDYPAARRVMLATNYRCPAEVVATSARMVTVNHERFVKPIRPPSGAVSAPGAITASDASAPDWADGMARFALRQSAAGRTLCFLSRTRGELTPMLLALVRAGVRHASAVPLIVDEPVVTSLVDDARGSPSHDHPFHALRRRRAVRGWMRGTESGDLLSDGDHAALDALLGWTVGFSSVDRFVAAFDQAKERIDRLRATDATVELATVHGAKGREWETVVVIGFEADRMPNARSLAEHPDPARALEEERRLAYVALTRATRRLILAVDPARPSPFLAEMGLSTA
ncbi:MAG: ATP-dependent helicase [Chloroflexi bacterium]|nr:ATP-dependent helicase [Chloroflexota bacterium]